MRNLWKKAVCLAMSFATALTLAGAFLPATAEAAIKMSSSTLDTGWDSSKNTFNMKGVSQITEKWSDALMGEANAEKLNPTGVSNVKISIVTGENYNTVYDRVIIPVMTEFTKASVRWNARGSRSGTTAESIEGIYYGNISADQTGDITFSIENKFSDAFTGKCYAIVLRYTGKSTDEGGVTAQYAKISTNGKITAHFNGYSEFAILVTSESNMQRLVNTYYHLEGSDSATVSSNTTTTNAAQNTATTNTASQSTTTSNAGTSNTTTNAAAQQTTATRSGTSSSGYYSAYTGRDVSIVDALKSCGESNASFRNRAQIASANGINGYRGTSDQNAQLLSLLKKGQLKKP